MTMLRDFFEEQDRMKARIDRARRRTKAIFILTWIATLLIVIAVGYVLVHPELIGQYAARIASGYGAQR